MAETESSEESPVSADGDTEEPQTLPSSVYMVGALYRFAEGLYRPFLQTFMVDMGASFAELGAFRSVGNIAPAILQPAWGAKSDQIGRRKPFVMFGILTGLFMVYMFLWAQTPVQMIVLYGIQSLLLSIQIPTWLSLIGGLMDEENRGDELGKLGFVTSLVSLIATIFTGAMAGFGWIWFAPAELWKSEYFLPFTLTAVIGIIASILTLTIREKPPDPDEKKEFPSLKRILSEPGDFRRFCGAGIFFSFAMSMAWPFFAVVQRDFLGFNLLEIGIASAIMTVMILVFSIQFGRLSDRVGRKPLIVFGRGILFVVPLIYAFATNPLMIYLSNAIAGIAVAASMNALTAYVYDVAPKEERGSYIAIYSMITGFVFMGGSLLAGLLGDALVPIVGWYLGAVYMLILSTVLRFFAAFFYLLLREPREYSSTIKKEVSSLMTRRRLDQD